MIKVIPMMKLVTNLPFLLLLACSLHMNDMIHAQTTQDSCSSNTNLANFNGRISFDVSSLNCFSVWTSEDFILRYSQAGPSLWSFVLSTPNTNSYIGMGFSPNGGMVGSSAVVGWVGRDGTTSMRRYFLGGQTPSQVLVDQGDLQIVGNTSTIFVDSSRIYMAFQLVTDQPRQRLVYSVGDSNNLPPSTPSYRLTQHRSQIAIRMNYATGQSSQTKAPYSNLKRAHGILNMMAWGILIPIGAMVARYLKHLDPLWFYVHSSVQSLGFILGLAGVIAGFVLDDRLDARVGKHKGLGISILVLGCLQVLALLVRPSIDAKTRQYWNWYHHSVGRLMILFAIVNIFYGIHLAKAGTSWNVGYGVVLGIYAITIVILEIKMLRKK
ncbi:putative cytochrome b561 and DOMON domain-containing protein [Helianthus annuus]|nr:putative cytochrome b561 and DOMON domain-containing protein [Helianthus annuus]KAJ0765440.1 putative cytochrome b561 and DOMON domain-containing protein [Helianthus annuus]